jgi:hypothetical protein
MTNPHNTSGTCARGLPVLPEATELRLQSNDFVHTPSFIRWAIKAYADLVTSMEPTGPIFKALERGYDLGVELATGLLNGQVPYRIEGSSVVLVLSEAQMEQYKKHSQSVQVDRL